MHVEPLAGEHYLHNGSIYRVEAVSQGTDSVYLIEIGTGTSMMTRYSTFRFGFQRVWKTGEVAKFLNRTPRSLYRYEEMGLIEKAKRYPVVGGRELRFYTKDDVLEIHEMISGVHQGRPRKDRRTVNNTLPDKASLLQMFRKRFGV